MLNSAAVGVNNVAAGGDVLGQARDEVVEGDCAEIQSAQAAYGDGAILLLLVADDEDVRHLLQAVLPDFTSDFSPRKSDSTLKPCFSGFAQFEPHNQPKARNAAHHGLHRSQPGRHRAGVVFDQHADETLERTQDRAVQHDRRTALVVLVHILAPRRTGMEKSTWIVPHCQWRPMASFSVYSTLGP